MGRIREQETRYSSITAWQQSSGFELYALGPSWNYSTALPDKQDLVVVQVKSKETQPKPSTTASPCKEEEENAVKGGRGRGQGKLEKMKQCDSLQPGKVKEAKANSMRRSESINGLRWTEGLQKLKNCRRNE